MNQSTQLASTSSSALSAPSSIQLAGKLIVRVRQGKRGPFAVGELITPVGTFKVKDTIIDQYDEGQYNGIFVIDKIYASCYTYNNGVISEIRATVSNIILDTQEDVPASNSHSELDPLDERAIASSSPDSSVPREESVALSPSRPSVKKSTGPSGDFKALSDEVLFGDLLVDVRANKPISLDPTTERETFRSQRDRLKFLGYKFDALHQTWYVPETSDALEAF
jgi:Protein of unknown function (DUF3275)